MNLTLTTYEQAGLAKACAAYNAGQPEGTEPLTAEQFANTMLQAQKEEWARRSAIIPSGEFVLRFPRSKMASILAFVDGVPQLKAGLDRLRALPEADLRSDLAVQCIGALVQAGQLTQEEADAVLAPA